MNLKTLMLVSAASLAFMASAAIAAPVSKNDRGPVAPYYRGANLFYNIFTGERQVGNSATQGASKSDQFFRVNSGPKVNGYQRTVSTERQF